MHFRNSCTRSTSSCADAPRAVGRIGRARRELLDARLDAEVPRHVGDEVAHVRKGAHRLDGHRLVGRQLLEPRHAHQPRLAVDLRPSTSRTCPPCSSSARRGRWPARPGSGARRRARPCRRSSRSCSRGSALAVRAAPQFEAASAVADRGVLRRLRRGVASTALPCVSRTGPSRLHLLDDRFELGRHRGNRRALELHLAVRAELHDVIERAERGILVRDSRRGNVRRGSPSARAPSA